MIGRHSVSPVPAKLPPVIIIGAHRSGTTATARALELLGLQIGQRLDSHHESKGVQRLHEEYLRKAGAAWHHPEPFLALIATTAGERDGVKYLRSKTQGEFAPIFGYRNNPVGWWRRIRVRRGAAWGWKEPRTTLFASCWLQMFPEARLVEVVRHPLAVALSIREREMKFRDAGDPPTPDLDQLDYCLRLALTYVSAGERLAGRTQRYRRVHFEAMQADAPKTLRELAAFCGLHPTQAHLNAAARSIRPPRAPGWGGLTSEEQARLSVHRDAVLKLGYDLPA